MRAVFGCFADASVWISSDTAAGGWPAVSSISAKDGQAPSISFVLSADGSDAPVEASASGDEFPIVSGRTSFGAYVFVFSSEGIRELVSVLSDFGIRAILPPDPDSPSSPAREGDGALLLCSKCVTLTPSSLSSIRVYDGVSDRGSGPHFVVDGNVRFATGNNMAFSEADGVRGFMVSASPGSGSGRVSCGCGGKSVVESALKSPDGHVRLFNDACYDIEPGEVGSVVVDGVARVSRELKIHAKCTACCTCDMYASIVNDRLVALSNAVRSAKADVGSLLGTYEHAVNLFNERMSKPDRSDVMMSMTGMPVGAKLSPKLDAADVRGKMERCAFSVVVKNRSFVNMSVKVVALSGSDTIVEAAAAWSDLSGAPKTKNADSGSGIVGSSFPVYPGRTLCITFVSVRNQMVKSVSAARYSGSATVSVSYAGGAIGNFSKSVEV